MSTKITNKSTLKICTLSLEYTDVCASLDDTIKRIVDMLPYSSILRDMHYRLNLVKTLDGIKYGFAYLQVSSPELYNLLLGFLPNGDVYIDESGCKKAYISISTHIYDDGRLHDYIVSPAEVHPHSVVGTTTLKCKAPSWVTKSMLESYFNPFNTDEHLHSVECSTDGVRQSLLIKYPMIRMSPDRYNLNVCNVYIQYSPSVKCQGDVSFARLMNRQLHLTYPTDESISTTLYTDYWCEIQVRSYKESSVAGYGKSAQLSLG
jgi:hypothetical protein